MGARAISKENLESIIGKEVWYRTRDNAVNTGKVVSVTQVFATVERTTADEKRPRSYTNADVPAHGDVYVTKEDLLADNHDMFALQAKENWDFKAGSYAKDIRSIKDLVYFCRKYKDIEKAVKQRSKEILGVEINIADYKFGDKGENRLW